MPEGADAIDLVFRLVTRPYGLAEEWQSVMALGWALPDCATLLRMPSRVVPTVGWVNGAGVSTSFEVRSIYELLEVIRKKYGLFTGESSVTALWHFVHGFQAGLDSVGQDFEFDDPPFREFHDWIAARFGFYASTLGWRNMLLQSVGDETAAFERFFVELDAFRRGAS